MYTTKVRMDDVSPCPHGCSLVQQSKERLMSEKSVAGVWQSIYTLALGNYRFVVREYFHEGEWDGDFRA